MAADADGLAGGAAGASVATWDAGLDDGDNDVAPACGFSAPSAAFVTTELLEKTMGSTINLASAETPAPGEDAVNEAAGTVLSSGAGSVRASEAARMDAVGGMSAVRPPLAAACADGMNSKLGSDCATPAASGWAE